MKSELTKIWNGLLDFIWPRKCLGCQQEGTLCCATCLKTLKTLDIDYQAWDKQDDFYFDHCIICLDYHQALTQNLIKTFKYQYLKNIDQILINILYQQINKIKLTENIIITNVPLHQKKKRQRGFDQTEILAKGLAKKINQPYLSLLKRDKFTKPQAKLSKKDRQKNVNNVFVVNKKINFKTNQNLQQVKDCAIILIDDVATTGATLNQATKVLKNNGFNKIIALTLAKN